MREAIALPSPLAFKNSTVLPTLLRWAIIVSAKGFGGGLIAGNFIAASQFVRGTAAIDRGDRFIYNKTNGALSFDPDGTGSLAQIQIATLSNSPLLTNNDILVIT